MKTGPSGERLGLGERLVKARERRGLRQLDVAREIGVCRETIARIEIDHIASERIRAKVRAWLEEQEAAGGPGAAAAAPGPEEIERLARLRERRSVVKRLGGERLRVLARLAVKRRAERARRAAEAAGRRLRNRRR